MLILKDELDLFYYFDKFLLIINVDYFYYLLIILLILEKLYLFIVNYLKK